MIAEHELIEQIADEALGRPLSWVCDFLVSIERVDPFTLLSGMWQAKYIAFVAAPGTPVPDWRCREILRAQDRTVDVCVVSTTLGNDWVYGKLQ